MALSPLPVVLLLISFVQAGLAQGHVKAVVSVSPDNHVFRGETVTLRCDIRLEGDTGWTYSWYKDGNSIYPYVTSNTYTFNFVVQYDSGTYTCRGYRGRDSQSSEISNAITLTVSVIPQAVLSVSPQIWLTEGDSVSLSCEVRDSSTGWTFSWYRAVPYRECVTPVTDIHDSVRYFVEILSDSIRGAGGSYTLSPAALHHTGVYVCRAERGEPAYQTQYSNTQPLWITGLSPPVSLIISPSRTQHFSGDSLSLSCEGQSDSPGWRVRGYTHSGRVSDCSSLWGSVTGSTCTIGYLYTSHTGVYWCQSESGGSSNPVNITVHNGDVILESSVHPVTVGDPLTLHCLLRPTITSRLRADLYKDGSLIQTQTAGEITIHNVSKSDEGVYYCKHPERGESPHSWVSVRAVKPTPKLTSSLKGAALVGNPVTLHCKLDQPAGWSFYWSRHTQNPETETNTATNSYNISSVAPSDGGQYWCRAGRGNPVYYTNYSDALWVNVTDEPADDLSDVSYSQVMKHNKKRRNKDTGAGPSEVTYAEIELKPKQKAKKKEEKSSVWLDTVYSEVRQDSHKGC